MSNIIRVKKRENPFVMLDKTGLRDVRLSWKAKGLLAYLISLPDDWKIHERELTKHSKDGRDSTRSAMKELIENGYVVRQQLRGNAGQFGEFETVVYEVPQEKEVGQEKEAPPEEDDFPAADGFSDHGFSDFGNAGAGETASGKTGAGEADRTKKDFTKKDLSKKDKENSPKRKKRVYELESLEMRMALKFESLIKQNDEKFKIPNVQSWCDQFRLMMEKDGRTQEEIHTAMTFAQSDDFWQSNVLSAEKLRKQMSALLIQAKKGPRRTSNTSQRVYNSAPSEFSDVW